MPPTESAKSNQVSTSAGDWSGPVSKKQFYNQNMQFIDAIHNCLAYPNPFNPVTTIQYELSQQSNVQITIYDLLGKEITTLISETQEAGIKSVQWDATNVAGGVYLYQIRAGEFVQTNKIVVMK